MTGGIRGLERGNSVILLSRTPAILPLEHPPMADLTALTLPVLPLTSGVVLPQMVVTIALETDEAKAAVDAVGSDDRLLLVPRLGDRYATVGAIARIEDRGQLPNGTPALVVRAEGRALVGTGVVGTGSALW